MGICYICGMVEFPKNLKEKLLTRTGDKTFRSLPVSNKLIDFSSNDYLGLSRNGRIFERASQLLSEKHIVQNGATGSRLLSGNHPLYAELEEKLAEFHQTESALVFNSGYDANIGFFSAVPQRGDIIFYDEYIHASIRDGIKMGNAKSYKFKHNDLGDLTKRCRAERSRSLVGTTEQQGQAERKLPKTKLRPSSLLADRAGEAEGPVPNAAEVYIVTESVFSMDGDSPNLKAFAEFCQENKYHLVVDEAHALGVCGNQGKGLIQELGLQGTTFARIVTFGKAMGCHGAAILGSIILKNYLVNFARSLIYTTGLPPHSVATILASYEYLLSTHNENNKTQGRPLVQYLTEKIAFFNLELETMNPASATGRGKPLFIPSTSAIHCCIISGNGRVKKIAEKIQEKGFDVRPILSPTVPEGQERLRICLHTFNTEKEITEVLQLLAIFTNEA